MTFHKYGFFPEPIKLFLSAHHYAYFRMNTAIVEPANPFKTYLSIPHDDPIPFRGSGRSSIILNSQRNHILSRLFIAMLYDVHMIHHDLLNRRSPRGVPCFATLGTADLYIGVLLRYKLR